jgi:hypothetical protein
MNRPLTQDDEVILRKFYWLRMVAIQNLLAPVLKITIIGIYGMWWLILIRVMLVIWTPD